MLAVFQYISRMKSPILLSSQRTFILLIGYLTKLHEHGKRARTPLEDFFNIPFRYYA